MQADRRRLGMVSDRPSNLIHWHPHVHGLVSEGVFLTDGAFLPLPKLASGPFLKLWEQRLLDLLLAKGKTTDACFAPVPSRPW